MPLIEIEKEWTKKFSDSADDLLSEFQKNRNKFNEETLIQHPNWQMYIARDAVDGDREVQHLPVLKNLLDNLPENIFNMFVSFSVITPPMVGVWHCEAYERYKGWKRYHIPLQVPNGVKFEIQKEGEYFWEVGKVYEFVNPEDMHRINYASGDQERIVIMIDVFEDYVPEKKEQYLAYYAGQRYLQSKMHHRWDPNLQQEEMQIFNKLKSGA